MISFGLKIAGTILAVYGGVRLAGIGIKWMKEGFRALEPKQKPKREED